MSNAMSDTSAKEPTSRRPMPWQTPWWNPCRTIGTARLPGGIWDLHGHGCASGADVQLPGNVRVLLYRGGDEKSTYSYPPSLERYDALVGKGEDEGACVHQMVALWAPQTGGWQEFTYGSLMPNLRLGIGRHGASWENVVIRRPLSIMAVAPSGVVGNLPVFGRSPTHPGLQLMSMGRATFDDMKPSVAMGLGWDYGESDSWEWELEPSHEDVYFFGDQLIINGVEVHELGDLVPLFSGRTTLFVHACTTNLKW